jgi:anti-sigma-K factor RskA
MTGSRHEEFEAVTASYALDVLDPAERAAFEAHLQTCDQCQADVAEFRRVTAALGLATDPVAPPASLRARTLAAVGGSTAASTPPRVASAPPFNFGWLAAAAALVLAAATGLYAWSLRSQNATLRQMAADASSQADRLRAEVARMRSESVRLTRTVDVLAAPDVLRVDLSGTPGASAATGRAFWSGAHGLLFSADRLPALAQGRVYQLWIVLPNRAPISAGLLNVGAAGSGTMLAPNPGGLTPPKATEITLAITNEPTGGSPGPTTPILLAGRAKTE